LNSHSSTLGLLVHLGYGDSNFQGVLAPF